MRRIVGFLLIVGAIGFAVTVDGQITAEPSEALVAEIRLLRQSIEKIGGQTGQVQLALGRLSSAQAAIRDLHARLITAGQYASSAAIPPDARQRHQEDVVTLQQQLVIENGRMADAQKYLDELQREMRRQ